MMSKFKIGNMVYAGECCYGKIIAINNGLATVEFGAVDKLDRALFRLCELERADENNDTFYSLDGNNVHVRYVMGGRGAGKLLELKRYHKSLKRAVCRASYELAVTRIDVIRLNYEKAVQNLVDFEVAYQDLIKEIENG